jgi:hypothetical protein
MSSRVITLADFSNKKAEKSSKLRQELRDRGKTDTVLNNVLSSVFVSVPNTNSTVEYNEILDVYTLYEIPENENLAREYTFENLEQVNAYLAS